MGPTVTSTWLRGREDSLQDWRMRFGGLELGRRIRFETSEHPLHRLPFLMTGLLSFERDTGVEEGRTGV